MDESNELHNRAMHVSGFFEQDEEVDIGKIKVDIASEKVDIETVKMNIEKKVPAKTSKKTVEHIIALYLKYGKQDYFGRTLVEETTGLKLSGASKLIKLMYENNIIEPIMGYRKGKYHFI